MNEFYVVTILMIYVLLVLSETLIEYYNVLTNKSNSIEDKILYPQPDFSRIVHKVIAPIILRVNLIKDYRLNMKRRPPIISVAHWGWAKNNKYLGNDNLVKDDRNDHLLFCLNK